MTTTGAAPRTLALELEVFSDFICPWCYIAHRRLAAARQALAGELALSVVWRPYELNPDMPEAGRDRKEYRTAKFGSWKRSAELDAGTVEAGAPDGIEFRYDLMRRTPNTLAAHRLVWSARGDRQDEVAERLFRAYFTQGRDIGDPAVLSAIAQEAGLPEAPAGSAADEATVAVRAEQARAASLGLTGVPFHLFGRRLGFSGAVPADELVRRLRLAARETAGAG
jgi:predicted DsbA family dithiol-disulfide isomerase